VSGARIAWSGRGAGSIHDPKRETMRQGARAMEHDFVYCPRCTRYSIFHWVRGLGQWECEDCRYTLPMVEELTCVTTTATLPS
jgi:ribosomal protein L37AE/L43A